MTGPVQRFYDSIADNYDHIFPLKQPQVQFVLDRLGPASRVIDIGCATGALAVKLAEVGHRVTGIDLDAKMIETAKVRAEAVGVEVRLEAQDMTRLDDLYSGQMFDGALCFGNTLVHLNGDDPIQSFLSSVRRRLSPDGMFLMQIINYDRVVSEGVRNLPTVENEYIRFARSYSKVSEGGFVDFGTMLQVKKTGEAYENNVPLFALRSDKLSRLFESAGFTRVEYYGSFKGDEFGGQSYPLIAAAHP